MAKVKVEIVGAYVDGNAPGETISIEDREANYLESIGYVKKVQAQRRTTKSTSKSRTKDEAKK